MILPFMSQALISSLCIFALLKTAAGWNEAILLAPKHSAPISGLKRPGDTHPPATWARALDTPGCAAAAAFALEVDPSSRPRLLLIPWRVIVILLTLALMGAAVAVLLFVRSKHHASKRQHSINRDPLTGLANRSTLIKRIECAIGAAKRGQQSALLLIDLDDFRILNDTLSYGAGDEVLVQVAEHIAEQVRPDDFVARFGEDAFAVLTHTSTLDQAVATAERIRASLEHLELQIGIVPISIYLTVSIGISEIGGKSSVEAVALRADSALCAAKEAGKNRLVCLRSHPDDTKDEPDAYTRIAMIEDALNNDRFILHFQPIIPIIDAGCTEGASTQEIPPERNNALKWVGRKDKSRLYEALLRIERPNGEIIPPGQFIPWAEAIGLIPKIDLWVLEHVIQTLKERPDMNISMNISAKSIGRSSFLTQVERKVADNRLMPGRLGFEITETAGFSNVKEVCNWMKSMRRLGCCFAIDDFGSGHTSMAYLSSLPVDIVKIAGSIVGTMPGNPSQGLIVEAISSVVHVAGAWTVAESVEDAETLSMLKDLHVDFAQGFYFARPSDLDNIPNHTLAG